MPVSEPREASGPPQDPDPPEAAAGIRRQSGPNRRPADEVRWQADAARRQVDELLVVLPNWVGDVVLATPVLAALRAHFSGARVTFLGRRYISDVVAGGGWHDEFLNWPGRAGLAGEWAAIRQAARMRQRRFEANGRLFGTSQRRFDLALLLPNSFRSAWFVWLVGARRRVGYARDGRGLLLTDRLRPLKHNGQFVPTPILPYYAALAEYVGCPVNDRKLRLGVTPEQEEAGRGLLRHYGLDRGQPYAAINPGAAFGASKCWPPEHFAGLCSRLPEELNLRPVLVGAPGEAELIRRIAEMSRGEPVCCTNPGTTLGSLKVVIREASLLVCNDTGPRHYGNAFDVPTVTLFGPTHQAWTNTDYAGEIKLQLAVPCGPCQLPVCPLDHRCLRDLSVEQVMQAAKTLLARAPRGTM